MSLDRVRIIESDKSQCDGKKALEGEQNGSTCSVILTSCHGGVKRPGPCARLGSIDFSKSCSGAYNEKGH